MLLVSINSEKVFCSFPPIFSIPFGNTDIYIGFTSILIHILSDSQFSFAVNCSLQPIHQQFPMAFYWHVLKSDQPFTSCFLSFLQHHHLHIFTTPCFFTSLFAIILLSSQHHPTAAFHATAV